ncbi:unnamed protein product [Vitrella brassicaformis CCMP3155]|uniref:Cytochrome b-c1 complex subunit 6 n=2 Tax=Vitrella brassicaformis TaxID=1169539 RepID=A0A0G4F7C5_VITBC|nr:unnamed protein product [Vitrella brassicaformis CCMP3155]|eukprot:CEM08567.1 unnamed protein product [Vitrella brassicaformis CCMP3155]
MAPPYYIQPWLKLPKPYIPPAKGEELVDPRKKLEPICVAKCSAWVNKYNDCVTRVRARTDGKGDCQSQYEKLGECIDWCLCKQGRLFDYLK